MKKEKEKENVKKIHLSPQQMFYTNALSIEAIVNILDKKGVLKREEVLEEIKKIGNERKQKMEEIDENFKKSK